MTYLKPLFDPDVFVSYSHGDPRGVGESPLKDWTHWLIGRLEGQILSLEDEFDDLNIWFDKSIDPTAYLTVELRDKVGQCGVLIIVMSKRYLKSSWCRDELDWFRRQVKDRVADQGRVFVLRAQPTDQEAWPDFLRDERGHGMPGFCFYDKKTGLPLGFQNPNEVNADFIMELCRLQTELTGRLRKLRDRAEKQAKASEGAPPPPFLTGPRRIYLHASADWEPARVDIGKALSQDGIVPLTARSEAKNGEGKNDLAAWQRDAALRMETARHCEALALLRAEDDDRFVGDLLEIGVDERERIESSRGKPLPCAVLDKSGANLPIDVSAFGITRFDVTSLDWRGAFRQWLDSAGEVRA